jgi:hypothetical protein
MAYLTALSSTHTRRGGGYLKKSQNLNPGGWSQGKPRFKTLMFEMVEDNHIQYDVKLD